MLNLSSFGFDWGDQAKCYTEKADPEMFFDKKRQDEAKSFCRSCPVQLQCSSAGNGERVTGRKEFGIWGGLTPASRTRRERSQQRKLLELQTRMKELLPGDKKHPNAS